MPVKMSMSSEELNRIIRPLREPKWSCDFGINYLEAGLGKLASDYGTLNLVPDFQRGHVWTEAQSLAFCEAFIRKAIPRELLFFQFNCPYWDEQEPDTDLPREIQCVDGLQRLTAITKMMSGEIKPFGLHVDALNGTEFSVRRVHWSVKIGMHNMTRKRDLLQYYLDINGGGTPHTQAELDRIREMLEKV